MDTRALNLGRIWIAVTGIIGAGGCAGAGALQSASSGQIGCATNDIKILDDTIGWASRTWVAECHGKRFFCAAVSTGKDQGQVNCKEEAAAARAPAPPFSEPKSSTTDGCHYDTQCKGDRVCQEGQCVGPSVQKRDLDHPGESAP